MKDLDRDCVTRALQICVVALSVRQQRVARLDNAHGAAVNRLINLTETELGHFHSDASNQGQLI